jgi:hypothetical protein
MSTPDQEGTNTAAVAAPADAAAATEVRRLDADGRDRPAFVLSFPRDPELDALVSAFESGNFALIREQAPKLAQSATDPAVRDAALELRRRIDPDPTVIRLLLLAFALFAFVAVWAYSSH